MQDLRVIGVDDGALLLSSDDGDRFRVAIDEVLHSTLRRSAAPPSTGPKLAPRDIQAQIRSGLTADEVAAVTGASVEYIQKFEGPVLAERQFIIESALNVPVHTALEDTIGQGSTFGAVIRARLQDLGATGERWASWKEIDAGWVVKLEFIASDIEHDARWQYEPKKAALAPTNSEAKTLSQQGELPGGLIPRLRAVGGEERAQDASRFDSGAFDVSWRGSESRGSDSRRDTAPQPESKPFSRAQESSPEAASAAIKRAPVEARPSNETADLLEALRRRRGEREAATWSEIEPTSDDLAVGKPAGGGIRLVDVPLVEFDDAREPSVDPAAPAPAPSAPPARGSGKKGRAAMPSWDEIVFGARSDDDPA